MQEELPEGDFLWELIYPKGKDNEAILSPDGRYVVRLFIAVLQGLGQTANPL